MFERKIEETIAHFRNETIAEAASISSRQIFDSEMPSALKRMFEVDLEMLVAEEKKRLLASPRFRYDEEEALALVERMGEKAREAAVFSAGEFEEALEKNVKLLFNYVCRPQWTLRKYLFTDREHAATDEIVDALRVFWHYEYFPLILREYFEQKRLTVINARKFTDLIERIDHEVVRNFDSRKTAHLTEPLFDLFNIGMESDEPSIPVEALSMFYDDKNLSSIVERLDQEKALRERITMHELVMLIGEADYTIGLDISTIINEQLQKGGMKKERDATAGQDFDIPRMSEYDVDGVHHGDLGHEDDALDFVISEEEQGVIMQDDDHIHAPLEGDLDDDVEIENVLIEEDELLPEPDEEMEEELGTVYAFTTSEDLDDETDGLAMEGDVEEEEQDFTSRSILNIETDLQEDEFLPAEDGEEVELAGDWRADGETEESGASAISDDRDNLPDIVLADEQDQPTKQYMESKDIIPDISLDEIESVELEDGSYDGDLHAEDPYKTTPLDDIEDMGSLDDDGASATAGQTGSGEEEIDWEKEAEDMEDLDLGDVEEEPEKISDSLPPAEKDLLTQQELPGAEELLSQLDLDEMDEAPAKKEGGRAPFDIPVVEEDLPPAPRSVEPEPAEEEPAVSVEQVIQEFGDLNQLIPDADKKKYMRKLFQKNEEAFTRAMQVLN